MEGDKESASTAAGSGMPQANGDIKDESNKGDEEEGNAPAPVIKTVICPLKCIYMYNKTSDNETSI